MKVLKSDPLWEPPRDTFSEEKSLEDIYIEVVTKIGPPPQAAMQMRRFAAKLESQADWLVKPPLKEAMIRVRDWLDSEQALPGQVYVGLRRDIRLLLEALGEEEK